MTKRPSEFISTKTSILKASRRKSGISTSAAIRSARNGSKTVKAGRSPMMIHPLPENRRRLERDHSANGRDRRENSGVAYNLGGCVVKIKLTIDGKPATIKKIKKASQHDELNKELGEYVTAKEIHKIWGLNDTSLQKGKEGADISGLKS